MNNECDHFGVLDVYFANNRVAVIEIPWRVTGPVEDIIAKCKLLRVTKTVRAPG